MLPTIDQLIVHQETSIKEVLSIIDANAQGVCFVVDPEGILSGVVTDGDVRRGLLNGHSMDTPIDQIKNEQFISQPIGTPKEKLLSQLNARIRHIPLVDENGVPKDYACLHRYNRFPVSEPTLKGNELEYVTNCITTNWISSQGKYVRQFEAMLAEYCNMPYAAAVSNGTVALHLALEALGIGEGDEVIVPDLTFAASINSIIYSGARPVLVDVDRDSWNISVEAVKHAITPRTKAIMPVHLYGLPANMAPILDLAKQHDLYIVEDSAEAIGSEYHSKKAGSMGDVATFSFFGNKTITTGEGGMVLFKDQAVYEKAIVLRDHGMSKQKRYWHEYVGYNYRLTNLQAAIGVAQMERVDQIVQRKIEVAQRYIQGLAELDEFILPATYPEVKNTYWLFTLLLREGIRLNRDQLMNKLQLNGVETRPVFYPMHQMPPYQKYVRNSSFANAEYVSKQGLCLPSYLELQDEEIDMICEVLKKQLSSFVY